MAVRWLLVYNKDWWKGKYHLKIHVDVTRDRRCSTWLAEHMTHALTDRLTEIPFNVHMTCSVNGYPVFMLAEKCFYKLNAFLSWPTLRWDLWRSCSFQDFKTTLDPSARVHAREVALRQALYIKNINRTGTRIQIHT